MRIYFSFDYKAGMAYLGMKQQPVMMDTQVVDINKLLDFLELRLGLHTVSVSDTDRLVAYFKCVRKYMSTHKTDADNQLYGSYTISPLATSREMLKWRDALAVCGWTKDTPAPSRRLKVLQGVEQLFAANESGDMSIRQRNIITRLKEKKGMMKDVTIVLPYDVELLHPVLKEIFALAVEDGALIEQIVIPAIEGNNNLAQLKMLLTAEGAQSMTLDPEDDSVRIWNFKDDMQAEELLALLPDDAFDVTIQPNTKLTDNYLRMMGKPVTGSSVANSAPQIIQLFFTGVALMARPLNVGALMQWLYAPMSPLPGNIRYRLAERLARTGGWCSKEIDDRNKSCYQILQEWIDGTAEAENGNPIDKKEIRNRQYLADVFLPDFEGGVDETLTAEKLHTFLQELIVWSKQRSAMIVQEDAEDQRISQLSKLGELCSTLTNLTDDYNPNDKIEYSEIEKHVACLYEPSEFVQYQAQATSRLTVSTPGQVVAVADNVLWAGLYDFEPMHPATDFLTPSEVEALNEHLHLWDQNDVRKLQQTTLLLPLRFCQKQITLITLDSAGGKTINKHPLIVRIEQQVKNHQELTCTREIADDSYGPVEPLTNNAVCGSNGIYTEIHRTDLINWKKHESPTSVEKLMQNPIDYALENIAYISDNGQSTLSNLAATKGNVAHAVIQNLFFNTEDEHSGYPTAIKARVSADYKKVFDDVVETKGAILRIQENAIERRQLFEQLRECIDHLLDIIDKDNLHVIACEMVLDGNTFGEPDEQTPQMHGFADMVLARENGEHIIFDFKWTSSKSYYQGLLKKNTSSQLAIYADLLRAQTKDAVIPTAYFLMPVGKLYSTLDFRSYYANKLDVAEGCEGDLIGKIVSSYRYRRNEIMSGKIEMGEAFPLDSLDYYNDTEDNNLLPLKRFYNKETKKEEKKKAVNDFSSYKHLKN